MLRISDNVPEYFLSFYTAKAFYCAFSVTPKIFSLDFLKLHKKLKDGFSNIMYEMIFILKYH
jgi:hypothetical protein